jgi:hypothetical protein
MTICAECGVDDECRPYGKGGAMICFDCAMKDEAETEKNFVAQLEAAGQHSDIVILGEETGPRPASGVRQ